mgnify:CR=1 FL=1
MSLPDRSIDPKILDCAKAEFLEKDLQTLLYVQSVVKQV